MATTQTNYGRFAAAALPDTHTVLGVPLKPLQLGHIMLLTRTNHPAATGVGRIDEAAIAAAVALCSVSYAEAVRALSARGVRSWWFLARVLWYTLKASWHREARDQLLRYLAAGVERPKWWRRSGEGDGDVCGTPFWLQVQVTLMREMGYDAERALGTTLAEAIWYCAVAWEAAGSITLVSDEERRLIQPPEFARN